MQYRDEHGRPCEEAHVCNLVTADRTYNIYVSETGHDIYKTYFPEYFPVSPGVQCLPIAIPSNADNLVLLMLSDNLVLIFKLYGADMAIGIDIKTLESTNLIVSSVTTKDMIEEEKPEKPSGTKGISVLDFIMNGTVNELDNEDWARWVLNMLYMPDAFAGATKQWHDDNMLYCEWEGMWWRVIGGSTIGDLWLRKKYSGQDGYDKCVNVSDVTCWSRVPNAGRDRPELCEIEAPVTYKEGDSIRAQSGIESFVYNNSSSCTHGSVKARSFIAYTFLGRSGLYPVTPGAALCAVFEGVSYRVVNVTSDAYINIRRVSCNTVRESFRISEVSSWFMINTIPNVPCSNKGTIQQWCESGFGGNGYADNEKLARQYINAVFLKDLPDVFIDQELCLYWKGVAHKVECSTYLGKVLAWPLTAHCALDPVHIDVSSINDWFLRDTKTGEKMNDMRPAN